jgi:hypothetical protein
MDSRSNGIFGGIQEDPRALSRVGFVETNIENFEGGLEMDEIAWIRGRMGYLEVSRRIPGR